jgi:hypothetical protein
MNSSDSDTVWVLFLLGLGILHSDGTINNSASIKRLAQVAVAYAKAGIRCLID